MVKQPQRYCSLHITLSAHPQPLAAAWMQRVEETRLFGPLALAANDSLPVELRQFRHCFQAALNGIKTDWRHWLGKGPGLTSSHDDTPSGMLLVAWYYGALDTCSGRQLSACPDNLQLVTIAVSVSYLCYAAQGYFALPLLYFARVSSCSKRTTAAIDSLPALRYASGADTLLGFWLSQQLLQGKL